MTAVTKPVLESATNTADPIDTLDPTAREKSWSDVWVPTAALIGVLIVMIVSLMAYIDSINAGNLK